MSSLWRDGDRCSLSSFLSFLPWKSASIQSEGRLIQYSSSTGAFPTPLSLSVELLSLHTHTHIAHTHESFPSSSGEEGRKETGFGLPNAPEASQPEKEGERAKQKLYKQTPRGCNAHAHIVQLRKKNAAQASGRSFRDIVPGIRGGERRDRRIQRLHGQLFSPSFAFQTMRMCTCYGLRFLILVRPALYDCINATPTDNTSRLASARCR